MANKKMELLAEWQRRVFQRSRKGAHWCTPGSQWERLVRVMILHTAIHLTAKKGDSFNFCPWSTESLVQPGCEVSELNVLLGQPVVGSEWGGKRSENTVWSALGKGTKGTRSRGEIKGVLALSAAYSWSISKQQILCFIPTDSLNVSVFAPTRCYL